MARDGRRVRVTVPWPLTDATLPASLSISTKALTLGWMVTRPRMVMSDGVTSFFFMLASISSYGSSSRTGCVKVSSLRPLPPAEEAVLADGEMCTSPGPEVLMSASTLSVVSGPRALAEPEARRKP